LLNATVDEIGTVWSCIAVRRVDSAHETNTASGVNVFTQGWNE
jgi:hypothetical protein